MIIILFGFLFGFLFAPSLRSWDIEYAYSEDASVQEEPPAWYTSLFIDGAFHYHFFPGALSGVIRPMPGFRAALGYEWRKLRFSLSSGYNKSAGKDPLVESLAFVPLTFRTGYMVALPKNFGLQADLGLGMQFSKTAYYETALDSWAGRQRASAENKLFAETRLYATYTLPIDFLKIYLGGGVDMVFETGGLIPQPVLETGVSVKPFTRLPPKKDKTGAEAPVLKPEEEIEPEEEIAIAAEAEPERETVTEIEPERELVAEIEPEEVIVTEAEPEEKRRPPLRYAVYFEAESGTRILEGYRPLLEKAGEQLRADPGARLTLRGYAAPSGTTRGQVTISAARVWFCVEYLKKEYGIAEERIEMYFFGAEEIAELEGSEWEYLRRVELIVE